MNKHRDALQKLIHRWQDCATQIIERDLRHIDAVHPDDPRYCRINGTEWCGPVEDMIALSRGLSAIQLRRSAAAAIELLEKGDTALLGLAIDSCRRSFEEIRHAALIHAWYKNKEDAKLKARLRHQKDSTDIRRYNACQWLAEKRAANPPITRGQWILEAEERFEMKERAARDIWNIVRDYGVPSAPYRIDVEKTKRLRRAWDEMLRELEKEFG